MNADMFDEKSPLDGRTMRPRIPPDEPEPEPELDFSGCQPFLAMFLKASDIGGRRAPIRECRNDISVSWAFT